MYKYDLIQEGRWEEVLELAANRAKDRTKSLAEFTAYNHNNIIGCAGEMAFELATGIQMDRRILPFGDDGYDFVLPPRTHKVGPTLVDVKTRSIPTGYGGDPKFFLKEKDLTKECDLFVLCTLRRIDEKDKIAAPILTPFVEIRGVIAQNAVADVAKVRAKYGQITYIIKLSDAQPIEELFTFTPEGGVVWTD